MSAFQAQEPVAGYRPSWRWLAVAVAYVALIMFVSSRPYLSAPGPEFEMKDKLAHFVEYAILSALLARAIGRAAARSFAVTFLLLVAIGATVAALDEVLQGTVPGREKDVMDWVADVAGVAAGGGLVLWFAAFRPRVPAEEPGP